MHYVSGAPTSRTADAILIDNSVIASKNGNAYVHFFISTSRRMKSQIFPNETSGPIRVNVASIQGQEKFP